MELLQHTTMAVFFRSGNINLSYHTFMYLNAEYSSLYISLEIGQNQIYQVWESMNKRFLLSVPVEEQPSSQMLFTLPFCRAQYITLMKFAQTECPPLCQPITHTVTMLLLQRGCFVVEGGRHQPTPVILYWGLVL